MVIPGEREKQEGTNEVNGIKIQTIKYKVDKQQGRTPGIRAIIL